MGILRGGLVTTVCVLLFTSLLVGNVLMTFDLSLDYENVQPELRNIMMDFLQDTDIFEELEASYPDLVFFCESNSEYAFSEEGINYVVPCDVISQGSEEVLDKLVTDMIEEVYYKEYDCGFFDCIGEEEQPLFLISEHAKNYWAGKFYLALVISIVLIAVLFFLVEVKSNALVITGALLMVSSLPFMKIKGILSFFNKSFLQYIAIFFNQAFTVFLRVFIFGLFVLGAGILWKFFAVGFKISDLVSKFKSKKK